MTATAPDDIEVAFDPCGGLPVLDAVEKRFICHDGAYGDMPGIAICDRYALVRGVLRDRLRGRRLYEDLTDIFEEAEQTYTGARLFAAYDLAALQGWFWWVLKLNKACRKPAYEWHAAYADYWKRRLADREKDTLPWRWNEAVLLSPHAPVLPKPHPWRMQ
jgi:hypothetical protein